MAFLGMAIASAALGIGGQLFGGSQSDKRSRSHRRRAEAYERELKNLERNRQEVINPYDHTTNAFGNLQVGTKAAEFQDAATDRALSNALDTLVQGNYGGGGATAIAQMALDSKNQLSASIEQQELSNQKLSAQGEQARQMAVAQGRAFAFNAQENREEQKLARLAGLAQENRRLSADYTNQSIQAFSGIGQTAMELAGGFAIGQGA